MNSQELENGDDNARAAEPTLNQLLETAVAGIRQAMTALHDDLKQEGAVSLARISTEMLEIQGNLANSVQRMADMSTTLNQTHTMAQAAQQMAS
ncbi:unnamed protein product [Phytophthora fragariaefolia]|uniref:Unnamed protein product n=1 Tax=Phytophthora fragariaefolia TaxID=1490495 RepID=A0A9W6Y196_9STRA|nr:unnamed protein product [Phytophthora fragariaefolia]